MSTENPSPDAAGGDPSHTIERAAGIVAAIAEHVPTLRDGAVRFGADLSGGHWYPTIEAAEDRGLAVVVPMPYHSDDATADGLGARMWRERCELAVRHALEPLGCERHVRTASPPEETQCARLI